MWREHVHILLIKPGHPFDAPFHRLRGDIQPRRGKLIAQEVKAPADPSDEGRVGVLQHVPLPDHVFPSGGFFGTPTSLSFFPAPLGKVEKSHINKKATAVVVHPPTPGYEFLRKAPEFLGFQLCKRPDLAVSS